MQVIIQSIYYIIKLELNQINSQKITNMMRNLEMEFELSQIENKIQALSEF